MVAEITEPGEKKDIYDQQIEALDAAIANAESFLKDADQGINVLIQQRGKLSESVQHLWIQRHRLHQEFSKTREYDRRPKPFPYPY